MTPREWFRRLLRLPRRRRLNRETEAEMRFHLEMETEAGLRRGLSAGEARRVARLRAGSVSSSMEEVRDQRALGWLDGTLLDLRQAWTALRRRPGFLLVAGGALAFGVAVNTVVFTLLYGVLLQPLPYREPDRLVRIYEASAAQPKFPLSLYNYLEDKRSNRTLAGIAIYTREDMQLLHGEQPERVTTVAITDDFFPTLGVTPALGRNFLPTEMLRSARVIILSHGFWTNRFHADPTLVGRTLRLDREEWTVVGIAPAGFQHVGGDYRSPLQGDTVAVWRPLPLNIDPGCAKGCHYTNAIARLAPGISVSAATEDLNRIMDELARQFPDSYKNLRARLEPLSTEVVGKSRTTVLIIVAAGALVLLLACINVAGLSVARVLTRRREFAIRLALGGGPWRILRAVLSENIVLGLLAGVAGLALAAALLPALRIALPPNFPRLHEVVFRWPVAAFALISALSTSALAGVVATFRRTSIDPSDALNEESRTSSGSLRTGRLRGTLVAAQMALACVLCFAALLLFRSSMALSHRDHGFNPKNVLTFELALPQKTYSKDEQAAALYAEIIRRFREVPGVRSAGFSTSIPWTGYDENAWFNIEGYTPPPGESVSTRYQGADDGFFDALGIRLVEGRLISPADQAKSPLVILVNETFARRYFPRSDCVGRILDVFGGKRRIIGVVADVRDRPADIGAEPAFWIPLAQVPFGRVRCAIRTDRNPLALVPAVRAALRSVDRELPIAEVEAMDDIAASATAERQFALWLCEAFAGLAVALAAVGVYAMLTYAVEQRRREIGIRLALGATRPMLVRMVVGGGLLLAVTGAGIGVLIAPAAGRALSSFLYGVSPTDAITLIAAPMLIVFIAAIGSIVPGWIASRSAPVSILREQ